MDRRHRGDRRPSCPAGGADEHYTRRTARAPGAASRPLRLRHGSWFGGIGRFGRPGSGRSAIAALPRAVTVASNFGLRANGRNWAMAGTADTAWLGGSIAALRGVGWGGKGRLHELTEAAQGKYHYTIGPYSDAVLSVKPGDRIRIETRDAFEGAIRSESDKPTE